MATHTHTRARTHSLSQGCFPKGWQGADFATAMAIDVRRSHQVWRALVVAWFARDVVLSQAW